MSRLVAVFPDDRNAVARLAGLAVRPPLLRGEVDRFARASSGYTRTGAAALATRSTTSSATSSIVIASI